MSETLPHVEDGVLSRYSESAKAREAAAELESQERWREAAARHDAVLALDPTIRFAQRGKARCEARASLAERLQYHLDHPDRLSSDDVLLEAKALLEEAAVVPEPGPRHREQVERLEHVLAVARTPVRVYLESDDATESWSPD